MPRLFGTDGIRGLANRELSADLALSVSQAAASVLLRGRHAETMRASGRRPVAVLARDPRASGEFLSAAVAAGLASSGVDVLDAGMLPTPAVSFLINDIRADFGVVVSASHNPAPDNGIKFFSEGGVKLPDEVEDRIEAQMGTEKRMPVGSEVGRIRRFADAEDRYVVHLLSTLPRRLDGLHIVIDCAHGAASGVSPSVFRDAGARITVIGADPDGSNINDGYGSTHVDRLQRAVVEHHADLGVAHDGDADRCIAVDANGGVVDGDHILAILAVSMQEQGQLSDNTLVATVMSNLGLSKAMARHGIRVLETRVGDRYVLEALSENGYSLGGEQSGHVIMPRFAPTGDGILTGLQLAAEVLRRGVPLAELAAMMTRYPQVLINVRAARRNAIDDSDAIRDAVAGTERELAGRGRVVLRASGTESTIRVMVEAEEEEFAEKHAQVLAAVVERELN